jgi:hypothetical protein
LTCRLGFAAYGQDFSRTYLEKIDLGYGGAGEKDIGLIEQSDLRRARSPKHRGNGLTCGALINGTHLHQCHDVHLE